MRLLAIESAGLTATSYADLRIEVDSLTRTLSEALAQQTATNEILPDQRHPRPVQDRGRTPASGLAGYPRSFAARCPVARPARERRSEHCRAPGRVELRQLQLHPGAPRRQDLGEEPDGHGLDVYADTRGLISAAGTHNSSLSAL